jgi:hypothetical protein
MHVCVQQHSTTQHNTTQHTYLSLTPSFVIHSSIHPSSLIHFFIHSFIHHSFIHPITRLIYSFIAHFFIYPLTHSFTPPAQTVSSLRQQLLIRPSTKEVTQLVEHSKLHQRRDHDHDHSSSSSLSALRAEIAEVRTGLERRATVRYVDDALRHKRGPPSPSFSDLMQVSDELKTKIERGERRQSEARRQQAGLVTQSDLARMQQALEEQLQSKAEKTGVEKVPEIPRNSACYYAWPLCVCYI